jgi:hypothetical protein
MKKWLAFTFALAVFAAGVAVGRAGLDPSVALAHPAPTKPLHLTTKGASGGALSWEQLGDKLELTVTGPDTTFLGVAELTDEYGWPDLGSGAAEVLYAGGTFELDLAVVESLTFYRLEAVATLREGVFLPCVENPGDCFPVRPPTPTPPWPRHLVANQDAPPPGL